MNQPTSHLSPARALELKVAAAHQRATSVDANGKPNGPRPTYTYDASGRLLSIIPPEPDAAA